MGETTKGKGMLQWHPAFYASLQIELEKDSGNLVFENEHQLGTQPMEIDILIIKKEKDVPIRKNIGRIFREHNIIEYKSPDDYLSVDDFYKVYGYACFYKADTTWADRIPVDGLTITLASARYPYKLVKHLEEKRGYTLQKIEEGIYYIKGDYIPIQLIITSKLLEEENLWLRNLTNKMADPASAEKLVKEYGKHKDNIFYQSVMDIIVRANAEQFQEVGNMCEALKELMKDEFDAIREDALKQGMKQGMKQGIEQGLEQGLERGIGQGIRSMIFALLEDIGEIPEELRVQINTEKDLETLKFYHKMAARATSIEQFSNGIRHS